MEVSILYVRFEFVFVCSCVSVCVNMSVYVRLGYRKIQYKNFKTSKNINFPYIIFSIKNSRLIHYSKRFYNILGTTKSIQNINVELQGK